MRRSLPTRCRLSHDDSSPSSILSLCLWTLSYVLSMLIALESISSNLKVVHSFVNFGPFNPPSCQRILPIYALRKNRNKNINGDDNIEKNSPTPSSTTTPGYQFFKGDGSYVPSGMTRDEYSTLRKSELDKEKAMNYGAWGPRFKRTDVPDGDWMVMPNLWTAGQVSRRPPSSGLSDDDDSSKSRWLIRRIRTTLQRRSLGMMLIYIFLSCFEIGIEMWNWKDDPIMNSPKAILRVLRRVILQKVTQQSFRSTVPVELIKVGLSVLISPLLTNVMDLWNRQYLVSKRRIASVMIASAIGLVWVWGLILSFSA